MKFSVLVPVYNVEQYLEECIQSIFNQTFQDFELILVDDGSKDESGMICDKFANQYPDRIKVVHKENQGLISARRVGIAHAAGDFCIFVDSDDFIEPDLLETIESYLKQDETLDMILYSFYYNRDGKREEREKNIAPNESSWEGDDKKELYEKLLYTTDITSIWTKAIRTSILKSDETDYTQYYGKNMAEDLLQSLYPMTIARKILFIDKALYAYRINNESISHSFRPETILKKNALHVYDKIREYLLKWNMSENIERVNARWFNDTMYLFEKCYESASNSKEKNVILQYEWKKFLPETVYYTRNKYENKEYQKLFWAIEKKTIMHIEWYFLRKKIRSLCKKGKRIIRNEKR